MKYKLHYAELNLQGDIPCYEFNKMRKLIDFIDFKCINNKGNIIWLIASNNINDIFVSDSYLSIENFLEKMPCWNTSGEYFLQEYSSFQEAYEVALSMMETHKLCYEPIYNTINPN